MGIDTVSLPSNSQNGKDPILHISLNRDIQNGKPSVHVRLGRAGAVGITKAILIGASKGQQRWLDAQFDLYVDLEATQAGVHMSRFSDTIDEVMGEIVSQTWPNIEFLAEYIAKSIIGKQKALLAEVHIRTSFPIERRTPVSNRPTQEVYRLIAQAVSTKKASRHLIGVEVEGMVACPCAQDMVREYTRVRLQEIGFPEDAITKMLEITPLATHNQRGIATLMIGTDQSIQASDLIDLAEGAMSSENYGLLKRPDELYIVNKAHANPRFVEDVAREILRAVVEKYAELSDDTFVWVHQRNEETIHKYDVEAEGWGTLGELRSEILKNINIEHHTSKEEWFNFQAQNKSC